MTMTTTRARAESASYIYIRAFCCAPRTRGCEQKLGAEPSTQDRSSPISTDGGARTTRAGGNHSKRARLRALARRGCGGGHALCKFGLRLAQRLEDAARPVEDARGRDALCVVRDEGILQYLRQYWYCTGTRSCATKYPKVGLSVKGASGMAMWQCIAIGTASPDIR